LFILAAKVMSVVIFALKEEDQFGAIRARAGDARDDIRDGGASAACSGAISWGARE